MARNEPFTLALGLSVAFHVLALALAAAPIVRETLAAWQASAVQLAAPATPQEVELLVPTVTVEPAAPPPQSFIRTDGLAEAAPTTPDSRFISDRNTRAASELAAEEAGAKDLPAQSGIDIPVVEVIRIPLSEGEADDLPPGPDPAAASILPPPVEPPPPDPAEPTTEAFPPPIASSTSPPPPPPPMDLEQIATSRDGEVLVQTDDAAAKPATAKDRPLADVLNPDAEPADLRDPAPDLRDQAPTKAKTRPPKSVPAATPAGFSGLREPTRQHGTITNRGPASIDAADTPVGRYMKEVTTAIEREWHRKRRSHADFVTYGTIRLEFSVNRRGQVQSLAIKNRNGANAVMQDFTLNAVLDAKIPPMPPGLPEIFDHDRLQISYDIIVY